MYLLVCILIFRVLERKFNQQFYERGDEAANLPNHLYCPHLDYSFVVE